MLKKVATNKLFKKRTVLRVTELKDLVAEWDPNLRLLVPVNTRPDYLLLCQLVEAGISNTAVLTSDIYLYDDSTLPSVFESEVAINRGDVIAVTPQRNEVQILFRESDVHHTVFLTNRCNSFCLMCSQPPTSHNDSWLIDEAIKVASHMRVSPKTIGFTGGEPLLLDVKLRELLDIFSNFHAGTQINVLTNGRLLADPRLAQSLLKGLNHPVTWMVPLYGHADFLHDFVVQIPGAFDQTVAGLLALRSFEQPIQLRIVLIEPVLRILPELCRFIGRNLPFVKEVALMGCEPTGFALANQDLCKVDILDWKLVLLDAVNCLRRAHIPVVLMNLPLCAIDTRLWVYAHKSISDWKRTFTLECDGCTAKKSCSGLFASHKKGWHPTKIVALRETIRNEAL
jgi:His-Xaa-Ser system radical SAM maturase HxsC